MSSAPPCPLPALDPGGLSMILAVAHKVVGDLVGGAGAGPTITVPKRTAMALLCALEHAHAAAVAQQRLIQAAGLDGRGAGPADATAPADVVAPGARVIPITVARRTGG
ncbi:hypothetical protein [Pararhodospirillum oryzae]|uniref:Uncharacterized protein n=1 Tax=Pararhodospirillum oryzae TaxID=478448 RepID=A0A512HA16_9PROT|nr:hypothetical protein [Pararhodospirillum oryzae]GEO82296.1 hypothetical protein ROR02_24270 [Pararhodospirillum oryzae]